jgi:hypothetical protein
LQYCTFCNPTHVMPGLVPGIHAQKPSRTSKDVCSGAARGRMLRIRLGMAGTSHDGEGSRIRPIVLRYCYFRFPQTAVRKGGKSALCPPIPWINKLFMEIRICDTLRLFASGPLLNVLSRRTKFIPRRHALRAGERVEGFARKFRFGWIIDLNPLISLISRMQTRFLCVEKSIT